MYEQRLNSILEKYKITPFEKINFNSEQDLLKFIDILDLIKQNDINITYLNNDLVLILLDLDTSNSKIIEKLKRINWEDFNRLFLEHSKNLTSKRKERIYQDFISFIKKELLFENLSNFDKLDLNSVEITSIDIEKNKLDIFRKYEKFQIEKDLTQKALNYNIDILFDYKEEAKKITVSDFVLYFNRRLDYFTNLLKNRVNVDNVVRVVNLKDLYGSNTKVSIIGLVSDIKTTAKGHYMIEVEDKSGKINCFVNKDNNELKKIIENLCLDEGIAIVGSIGDGIIWTDEIVIPSPPNETDYKTTAKEEYIIFMSDLHFGAGVFVDEAFEKFLDWINGRTQNEQLNKIAKKVKYIVIPGDIIEGIGIYPDQGKDARILSSELQYHEAARWLSKIPKDIGIIIIPGNHDTDRLSEPQPKLPYDKAYALYNLSNILILSNPSRVRIFNKDSQGGLEVYMYHGGSLFYYADKIKHLREAGGAKTPEKVVEYLLEKRHLAPSHGATLYVPDNHQDPLVIKSMPDFFAVGHTHKLSLSNYKGCTICSCGCWVEMSDYQEKMGMYPDVGKIILINTKTRKPKILSFYTEKHKQ